jgi:hypothetical protein
MEGMGRMESLGSLSEAELERRFQQWKKEQSTLANENENEPPELSKGEWRLEFWESTHPDEKVDLPSLSFMIFSLLLALLIMMGGASIVLILGWELGKFLGGLL